MRNGFFRQSQDARLATVGHITLFQVPFFTMTRLSASHQVGEPILLKIGDFGIK